MRDRVLAGILVTSACLCLVGTPGAYAQATGSSVVPPAAVPPTAVPPTGVAVADDYVIGAEDVLAVLFWREQDMSGEVTVRPDGIITLPLLGDIKAAGLKPQELRDQLQKAAGRYLADANVTVVVRQVNSRKVFITGQVATPGAYPLAGPRTVMQVIALAGGVNEYADAKNISIMRTEQGKVRTFKFNYKDVLKGRNLEQNILLHPGDTVVVP